MLAAVQQALAAEPDLRWAYVFGSVARRQPWRDVDIAVMPAASMPAGAVALGGLIARLEAALGCKVDLVDLTHENLPFVGPMLRERVVVLDRDTAARRAFEISVTSRWIDMEPVLARAAKVRELAMQRRLRGGN